MPLKLFLLPLKLFPNMEEEEGEITKGTMARVLGLWLPCPKLTMNGWSLLWSTLTEA